MDDARCNKQDHWRVAASTHGGECQLKPKRLINKTTTNHRGNYRNDDHNTSGQPARSRCCKNRNHQTGANTPGMGPTYNKQGHWKQRQARMPNPARPISGSTIIVTIDNTHTYGNLARPRPKTRTSRESRSREGESRSISRDLKSWIEMDCGR
jgi:hypothetical protein